MSHIFLVIACIFLSILGSCVIVRSLYKLNKYNIDKSKKRRQMHSGIKLCFYLSIIFFIFGYISWNTGYFYSIGSNKQYDLFHTIITTLGWLSYMLFFNLLVWLLWIRITYTFDNTVFESNKKIMMIIGITIIFSELCQALTIVANIPALNDPFGVTVSQILNGLAGLVLLLYIIMVIYFVVVLFKLINYASVQYPRRDTIDGAKQRINAITSEYIEVVSKYVVLTVLQLLSTITCIVLYFVTLNTLFQQTFDILLFMIDLLINLITIYLQLVFASNDYKFLCGCLQKKFTIKVKNNIERKISKNIETELAYNTQLPVKSISPSSKQGSQQFNLV